MTEEKMVVSLVAAILLASEARGEGSVWNYSTDKELITFVGLAKRLIEKVKVS